VKEGPRADSAPLDALTIGSRRSPLARAQAEWVGARLVSAWPQLSIEYQTFSTAGDRDLTSPLPEIGTKGLFTADLERALVDGTIDLAVHSLKDLPTDGDADLPVLAIPTREDPRDVLILREDLADVVARGGAIGALPAGARVGTSSTRRAAQLRAQRDDVEAAPIRGNVETRLKRLEGGDYEALILAAAGLRRLKLWPVGTVPLETGWLPAPAQGALAVQGRSRDERVAAIAVAIDDPVARAEVTAERALLGCLEGGCQLPVAARAGVAGSELRLAAAVFSVDASRPPIQGVADGPLAEAERIGERLGRQLLDLGAADLIDRAR